MGGEDHHDPPLPVQPVEEAHHERLACRVQSRRGLVENQGRRLHRQHAGHRHSFFLAEAQVVNRPVAQPDRPDGFQGGGDPVPDLGLRKAQVPRAEGNILLYARTKELVVRVLEDHADFLVERLRGIFADVAPRDPDRPLLRLQQAGEHLDQGAFSRSVRSEDSHELPLPDPEIDAVERRGPFRVDEGNAFRLDRPFPVADARHPCSLPTRSQATTKRSGTRIATHRSLRPIAPIGPKGMLPV